jgi:hypothetical protein
LECSFTQSNINLAEHFPKFGEDPSWQSRRAIKAALFCRGGANEQAEGLEQTSLALQYPSNLTPSKKLEAQVWWIILERHVRR